MMKYKCVGWIFALLFLMGFISVENTVAAGGVNWYTYQTGMELGQKENKKIFLHFWAEWCDSCKIMDRKTFGDSAVIAYLNKNFISIKVNSDKERAIVSEYNIRGLPDNWFIAENNQIIGNQPGNIPPDKLLPLLRYIQTNSYKEMSYSRFLEMK